ncbi:serine carboxypeptidase [Irpex lacteus]|nr:serine carboxypeptidase [Irpex lacteus]
MLWAVIVALSTILLSVIATSTQTQQQAFSSGATYGDEANVFEFSAFGSLNALSEEVYTSLRHPLVPGYGLRVKKSREFCDGGVNAYTGYIDIAARHLFFYFFESRRDPSTDDVLFWTNGGPGCSSSVGLFMENGPCRVTGANETTFHPYSWNEVANIFFIDQPIGTGFSYAEFGEYVSTTEEAARDIGAFMLLFFEHFTSFQGRPFHIAGESYGGRAVPAYAAYIVDQNKRLAEVGTTPINLKSIILANGCSDWSTMLPSFYNVACEHHSAPPVIDISTCVALKRMLPRCKTWLQEACYNTTDPINCKAAYDFCSQLAYAYDATKYNPYDITKKCEGDYEDTLCYPATKNISLYLSQPSIQQKLGVDQYPGKPEPFAGCNMDVSNRFGAVLDNMFPTVIYIEQLLERDVKVLVYVGDVDWICNWLDGMGSLMVAQIGNERMTLKLQWHGQEEFASQPLRGWNVTSDSGDLKTYEAGLTRGVGPLTYATVHGGGHMTPYDRPFESLELIKRWLAGEDL